MFNENLCVREKKMFGSLFSFRRQKLHLLFTPVGTDFQLLLIISDHDFILVASF